MNVTIIELSQSETSPNWMKKRPREDKCDDAALLPSVKKPHTDFIDLLGPTGEDKEQINEQEKDSRDDRKSGIEGVKGGKNQKSQNRKRGGAEEGGGGDESQRHIEHQEELGNEKKKLKCKGDKIKKEKNKKEKLAQKGSCCKYNHDY